MNGHPGLAKEFGLCLKQLLRDLKRRMKMKWVSSSKRVCPWKSGDGPEGSDQGRSVRKVGLWSEGDIISASQRRGLARRERRGQPCLRLAQRWVGQGTRMARGGAVQTGG